MIRPMTAELIACFQDTLQAAQEGELAQLTKSAAESSVVYPEGTVSGRLYAMWSPEIRVTEESSFAAAARHVGTGRIAVLNFANPHFPGGGVSNGAMAQEECLCRSSNLYLCLDRENVQEEYYRFHREQTDYFFSDRLVYTRGVTVFKDDGPLPRWMPKEAWFQVDVLTCAAPYLAKRRYTNTAVLMELLQKRIGNILEAAIDNGVDVLILGAFGCGAFKNPPKVVAEVFREVLTRDRYRGAFKKVVFAIKPSVSPDSGLECPNLAAFTEAFSEDLQQKETVDRKLQNMLLPGGIQLETAEQTRAYRAWRGNNPYFGKQFSVFGDALSTLEGYHPRGYHAYYKEDVCKTTGVSEMGDTWWGKVLEFFGGHLLVNNAWSGAAAAIRPEQQSDFPSGCSSRRTGALHIGNILPDVVMVYIGINDWAIGLPLEDSSPDKRFQSFRGAYEVMLSGIRKNYPQAEVWCCTLSRTCMESKPHFRFPEAYGGVHIQRYNDVIRRCAAEWGCRLLDVYAQERPIDTVDGIHPTAAGMDTLAQAVLRSLGDAAVSEILGVSRQSEAESASAPAAAAMEPDQSLRLWLTGESRLLQLEGQRHMAGRSTDCELRLTSPYAARYQATFIREQGRWFLRDNNSKNGTYVNGVRLDAGEMVMLKKGDRISFARKEEVEVM